MTDEIPLACCPLDREPLIFTFERPGFEFLCLVCGSWYEFLHPIPRTPTATLRARHDELRARFDSGDRGPDWD